MIKFKISLYLDNDNNRSRSEEDEVYVNVRNKGKVHSLLTALDELNYAPYMPPQAETRIHGIIQRRKRRRDGEHIEEVKLTLTNIEQCKPFAVIILYSYAIHACTRYPDKMPENMHGQNARGQNARK